MERACVEKIIGIVKGMRDHFMDARSAGEISSKGDVDFVTSVDVRVQSEIREALWRAFPQIQFMGEEQDNSGVDFFGAVWILDPVDGTTNLIHRFRHSAVSLALSFKRRLELGIVYDPYADELFLATRGGGAFLNGEPIHVSGAQTMKECLVSVGTAPYYHDIADENFNLIKRVFLDSQDIRRIGSAAIDLAYVACGRTDAFFERNLKPWDYAAGALLVKEAGGRITDFAGGEIALDRPCSIVAGAPQISRILVQDYMGGGADVHGE